MCVNQPLGQTAYLNAKNLLATARHIFVFGDEWMRVDGAGQVEGTLDHVNGIYYRGLMAALRIDVGAVRTPFVAKSFHVNLCNL